MFIVGFILRPLFRALYTVSLVLIGFVMGYSYAVYDPLATAFGQEVIKEQSVDLVITEPVLVKTSFQVYEDESGLHCVVAELSSDGTIQKTIYEQKEGVVDVVDTSIRTATTTVISDKYIGDILSY